VGLFVRFILINVEKSRSMTKIKVRIGGVPEHFNYPWHYAISQGWFADKNIELSWINYPNGTGAMCGDLRENKLDLALVLTEGIVTDILKGNPAELISTFVESPLLWGIHVPAGSSIISEKEVEGKTFAISRPGSGSHIMAFVDAIKRGNDPAALKFQKVENLEGARKAFKDGKAEIFLWEKFMTKPLVDSGEFRRIGIRPTPWPCFMLAGRKEFIKNNAGAISLINETLIRSVRELKSKEQETIVSIARFFNLPNQDVAEWYSLTSWSNTGCIQVSALYEVIETLLSLTLVPQSYAPKDLCYSGSCFS
jgi:ABC-type nitrate/sulfonate/bicarbonate transport system substrate-binding protein